MPNVMEIPKCKFTETDLTIEKDVGFDEWQNIGKFVLSVSKASPFWIGDWVRRGEASFGETYSQALEMTGLRYDTLVHIKYVSEHIPQANRFRDLSYSHHRLVASMSPEDQKVWLIKAREGKWSVLEFRQELEKALGRTRPVVCRACQQSREANTLKSIRICEDCFLRFTPPEQA